MIKKLSTVLFASTLAFTGLNADNEANTQSVLNQMLQKIETSDTAPDWLKRTSLSIQVEEDFKPVYEFETIQPIYQFSENDMTFWQFNSSYTNSIHTHNFGLGYRNIINPELMLGINSFYDYQAGEKHRRWSVGIEAIGKKYEFRANRYMALSDEREISDGIYEEALSGWDAEIGGHIIPDNNLKVYVGYSVWQGIEADDLKQGKVRMTYPLNRSTIFELGYTHDNNNQGDNIDKSRVSAQLKITLGAKTPSSKNVDEVTSLVNKLLIPVERENKIIVETKNKGNFTITIGRSGGNN